MTDTFQMPPVEVGEIVLWYPEADTRQEGVPAMVTAVFGRIINACCIGSLLTEPAKMSVRHVGDPILWDDKIQSPNVRRKSGGWEYRPAHKRLLDKLAFLEQMGLFDPAQPSGQTGAQPAASDEPPAKGKKSSKVEG